jgi:hypothetical protein
MLIRWYFVMWYSWRPRRPWETPNHQVSQQVAQPSGPSKPVKGLEHPVLCASETLNSYHFVEILRECVSSSDLF